MKQLTKEQLTEMVHDTMVSVYRSKEENLTKRLLDAGKDTDHPCLMVVRSMAEFGTEIISECNQVLIETLYKILYTDAE